MATIPRLYIDAPLAASGVIALDDEQSNYLLRVLRLEEGAPVRVFNGRDGEWSATIKKASAKRAEVTLTGVSA